MKVRYLLIGVTVLFIVGLLTASSYAKIDPKTAVAIWTFDEGKGDIAIDSSGKGIDGKLMDGPKWVKGKIGNALEFDGKTAYVNCGSNPLLVPTTNQFTVTVWVLCTGTGKISILGNNVANWGLRFNVVPTLNGFVKKQGQAAWLEVQGNNVPQNEWVHLSFVWDGKTETLYQNGKKIANAPEPVEMTQPIGEGYVIGRRGAAASSEYFSGTIDDVGIFSTALAENDINSIMVEGLAKATGVAAIEPAGKLAATWASIKAR